MRKWFKDVMTIEELVARLSVANATSFIPELAIPTGMAERSQSGAVLQPIRQAVLECAAIDTCWKKPLLNSLL